MANFTGTASGDYIYNGYVSTGVTSDPAGSRPTDIADTIYGNGGSDYIDGAGGADTIYTGAGNDTAYGGAGDDFFDDYTASSYGGSDLMDGGAGNDTMYGYDGWDSLYGGDGSDALYGEGDNDILDGGTGSDRMYGGDGSDTYYVDSVGDYVEESADTEYNYDIVYASVSFTIGADLENLTLTGRSNLSGTGNGANNDIQGNDGANLLGGLGGNDNIYGGTGNDTLQGGTGNDYLSGDSGNDALFGDDGNDTLGGGGGVDTLTGGTGNDTYRISDSSDSIVETSGIDTVSINSSYTLRSDLENLELTGSDSVGTGNASNNVLWGDYGATLYGLAGNDTLNGGYGNETLDGGTGADSMSGGYYDDTYYVDNVGDVIKELPSGWDDYYYDYYQGGNDTVFSSVSFTLGAYVENLTLSGTAANATGNDLANILTGNASANSLSGLAGADTLTGAGGNDSLNGGTGTDSMSGDTGNDTYYVDATIDKVIETTAGTAGGTDIVYASASFTLGANVESLRMIPGSGAINGTGNDLGNELWGTSGVNTLRGLAGADSFDSGSGADVLVGGLGNDVFKFSSTVGSDQAARDRLVAGDGAVAFEKAGSVLGDRFDFSKMDANSSAGGQQHFVFGTTTGVGHLWVVTSGTDTLIRGNVDGDSAIEFEVAIADGAVGHTAYTAADFIL